MYVVNLLFPNCSDLYDNLKHRHIYQYYFQKINGKIILSMKEQNMRKLKCEKVNKSIFTLKLR